MDAPDRRERLKKNKLIQLRPASAVSKKWVLFGGCVLALILLAVICVFTYRYLSTQSVQPSDRVQDAHVLSSTTISSDEGTAVYAPYKSGIVMATRSQVSYWDTKGEAVWKLDLGVLNPIIKVSDSYILLAGKDTKEVYLLQDGNVVLHTNASYNIINAGIAKNGSFFIVENEPYYKGLLTVRDSKDNDLFVWHSGNAYIVDAAFNARATQIAVCTLSAFTAGKENAEKNNTYTSALQLFKLHESEPHKTYTFENTIATNLYLAAGNFMLLTTDGVYAYAAGSGDKTWDYKFEAETLRRAAFFGGRLALLTGTENNKQALHLLGANGKCSGKVENLENAGSLSLTKSIAALSSAGGIAMYNMSGILQYTVALPKTYNDICLFNNGQYFLGAHNIVLDLVSAK